MKSRSIIKGGCLAIALIGITWSIIFVWKILAEVDEMNEQYCSHGSGLTTLKGKVVDFYTKKPIDSVEISIVYGASWNHYLDTIVKQNDSLYFTFDAPNDCEPYFFTISNQYYWADLGDHPAYKNGFDKGMINNVDIYFKPATVFEISMGYDTLNRTTDSVLLEFKKGKSGSWETWSKYYNAYEFFKEPTDFLGTPYPFSDSSTIRTISQYYDMEGNIDYGIRWIKTATIKHPADTLTLHFKAIPFDTVHLNYTFKNSNNRP